MSRITHELILTATGGAELIAHQPSGSTTLWASDADEDFKEEFPDLLDENDANGVFDYLVEEGHLSDDEADAAELSIEQIEDGSSQPIEGELITADEWDDEDGDGED